MGRKLKYYKKTEGWKVEDVCHSANDHIVAALILFDTRECAALQTLDAAGFLAHLGFELLLKAALLQLKGEFPNEHNLKNLRDCLSCAGCDLNLSDEDSETFDFLIEFHRLRYHDPHGLPHVYQQDRCRIHQLLLSLRERLPERISQTIDNITHNEKSGRYAQTYRKNE